MFLWSVTSILILTTTTTIVYSLPLNPLKHSNLTLEKDKSTIEDTIDFLTTSFFEPPFIIRIGSKKSNLLSKNDNFSYTISLDPTKQPETSTTHVCITEDPGNFTEQEQKVLINSTSIPQTDYLSTNETCKTEINPPSETDTIKELRRSNLKKNNNPSCSSKANKQRKLKVNRYETSNKRLITIEENITNEKIKKLKKSKESRNEHKYNNNEEDEINCQNIAESDKKEK